MLEVGRDEDLAEDLADSACQPTERIGVWILGPGRTPHHGGGNTGTDANRRTRQAQEGGGPSSDHHLPGRLAVHETAGQAALTPPRSRRRPRRLHEVRNQRPERCTHGTTDDAARNTSATPSTSVDLQHVDRPCVRELADVAVGVRSAASSGTPDLASRPQTQLPPLLQRQSHPSTHGTRMVRLQTEPPPASVIRKSHARPWFDQPSSSGRGTQHRRPGSRPSNSGGWTPHVRHCAQGLTGLPRSETTMLRCQLPQGGVQTRTRTKSSSLSGSAWEATKLRSRSGLSSAC